MVLDNTIRGKKDKKRRNLYYGMQRKIQQEQIALSNRNKHHMLFGTGQRPSHIVPLAETLRKTRDAGIDYGRKTGARTRAENKLKKNKPKAPSRPQELEKPYIEKDDLHDNEDGVVYLPSQQVHPM